MRYEMTLLVIGILLIAGTMDVQAKPAAEQTNLQAKQIMQGPWNVDLTVPETWTGYNVRLSEGDLTLDQGDAIVDVGNVVIKSLVKGVGLYAGNVYVGMIDEVPGNNKKWGVALGLPGSASASEQSGAFYNYEQHGITGTVYETRVTSLDGRFGIYGEDGYTRYAAFTGEKITLGDDYTFVVDRETANIGIGIQPERSLHIKDVMRLEPRATAPAKPGAGDLYFDSDIANLCLFNGSEWIALAPTNSTCE